MRARLIKTGEYPQIWGELHQVEGTGLYVLELLNFGFAYASYYVLLNSRAFLDQLDDPAVREAVLQHPTRRGKHLTFGKGLERDPASGEVFYVGDG